MKQLIKSIQYLLIPFGLLYGAILQIRNWGYDVGILKSESFAVPVISVGNITAGGTGKTPFTIFLAQALGDSYKRIAIVSRGYGRKSTGVQLVASRGQLFLDAEQAGDEPYLLARSLPEAVIVVSEKRTDGIRMAINKFQSDLIILDDAFQHRSVKRNLDILLVNAKEAWQGNFPIPAGTLREFRFNYQRAQLIVCSNLEEGTTPPFTSQDLPVFQSTSHLNEVVDIQNKVVGNIEDFKSKNVLAFAGIAHPENFFTALSKSAVNIKEIVGFRDHYNFTEHDLIKLFKGAGSAKCEVLLCTEKDLVKMQGLHLSDLPLPIYAVRQNLSFDNHPDLIQTIENYF